MEYYKSICPKCSHSIYWVGPKTNLVKVKYPTCECCGTKTTAKEQRLDRESAAGRSYNAILATVLSGLLDNPPKD